MIAPSKLLLCAAVLAAALVAGLARPVAASAGTPCWKALLTDWYDGRIDNTYPVHCYDDALNHLPPDVQTYSSAHDDILRALQSAKAKLRQEGKKATGNVLVVPPTGGGGGKNGGGGPKGGGKTSTTSTNVSTTPSTPTQPSPGRKGGKGLTGVADQLNPSSPSSVPLPLLVLGALAILLVAAGAAGLLVKRHQGRKPAP